MYVENKDGDLDGVSARIGWVTFSKTGQSIYYRGRTLQSSSGRGIRGNYVDVDTGEEFWVSGVKQRGSNAHPHEAVRIEIDADAAAEYAAIRSKK
jgi:hypothetical protein